MAGLPRIQTLDHSLRWLDDLERAGQVKSIAAGPLQPHLAYGMWSKAELTIAHDLHIANHRQEILTA